MTTTEAQQGVDCLAMLSPRAMTVAGLGGSWCVAECKSRHEKALAFDLFDAGFDYFLPLIRTVKRRGGTGGRYTTYAPIPALNGYLFAASREPIPHGDLTAPSLKGFLLSHRSVYDLIEVHPGMQRTLANELDALHGAILTNPNFGSEFIVKGRKCRVVSGPYIGKAGIIDATGKGYAILTIETLGQHVPLEIPLTDLEPVDDLAMVA